jgi:recombination protein RecR
MEYPTKLVEDAVAQIAKLPGIGRKTALRLVLHILRQPAQDAQDLASAIETVRLQTRYCSICFHISDAEVCSICANPRRDPALLCVVESSRDIMAIESTSQFRGRYHVLGGVISPMDGIGPEELNMAALLARLGPDTPVQEIILALGATVEGDTTGFYIQRKVQDAATLQGTATTIKVSTLARGLPVGGELEYADEITLARSIAQRISY